jgi:hypothetical protein
VSPSFERENLLHRVQRKSIVNVLMQEYQGFVEGYLQVPVMVEAFQAQSGVGSFPHNPSAPQRLAGINRVPTNYRSIAKLLYTKLEGQ